MSAPPKGSIVKAQSTKRPSPPHPDNSGGSALRAGIEKLVEHRSETKSAPTRPQGA
jgi:hypothetical protein